MEDRRGHFSYGMVNPNSNLPCWICFCKIRSAPRVVLNGRTGIKGYSGEGNCLGKAKELLESCKLTHFFTDFSQHWHQNPRTSICISQVDCKQSLWSSLVAALSTNCCNWFRGYRHLHKTVQAEVQSIPLWHGSSKSWFIYPGIHLIIAPVWLTFSRRNLKAQKENRMNKPYGAAKLRR